MAEPIRSRTSFADANLHPQLEHTEKPNKKTAACRKGNSSRRLACGDACAGLYHFHQRCQQRQVQTENR
jgi:hypothetical protein